VDVAIAQTGVLQEPVEYTGSTRPARLVSLRSQVEGRLLNLQVDVGAPVKRGQILARLDDSILQTTVTQAQAELGALQSEVASAQTQVKNAEALAQQAKAELQQAQVDAARLRSLQQSGAISQQQAEVGQTAAATAQQKYNAAIAQIATEQQAVAAAQGRVAAQRSAVAQERERQSYALLASPITGVVLEKVSQPGDLVQPGGGILQLGDFSSVKVLVPVSELDLSNIRVGQSVPVRLDAFPNEELIGKVTLISPAADAAARQLPVEITIPNSNGRIGSGLLARVSFEPRTRPSVVVPQTALAGDGKSGRGGAGEMGSKEAQQKERNPQSREAKVFVVSKSGNEAKVQARPVQVGTRASGKVEILSGLRPGEQFVARSSKPLKDGETVRVSILSKTPEKQEQR
jgi:multidrug efflux pump subunit AcrA (membrane-fusion protein)